jgi:phosphate transport system protein
LVRLMDIGLERLGNMVLDMAKYSEDLVTMTIDAYKQGKDLGRQSFEWSEQLRLLQDEISELAVELMVRYHPVASDLRFVKSCMDIAYGLSRVGRYANDISRTLQIFGDLTTCDKTAVERAGDLVKNIIRSSIKSFTERDIDLARKLKEMDNAVDEIYVDCLREAAQPSQRDTRCVVSATLIIRYLERIADHATHIGDSVLYIVSGERSPRK